MILIVVLLPAPLGPSRPTISPLDTLNEIPWSTLVPPYEKTTLSNASADMFDSLRFFETEPHHQGLCKNARRKPFTWHRLQPVVFTSVGESSMFHRPVRERM